MKSYSQMLALSQTFTENTSSANQALLPQFINDSVRTIATMRGGTWPWLEKLRTILTVASQPSYVVPASVRKIADLYVTVGGQVYWPELIYDPEHWKLILAMKLGESNIPRYAYQQGRRILFSPVLNVTGETITFRSRENVVDLNAVDYTTGTITSIANGATTVTGFGTTWTAPMAGRYIRITATTPAGGGDELWYEIASVTNATTLELFAPYEGTTLAAATAAYAIGQMSLIPESYDVAPCYRSAALYWQMKNPERAKSWWMLYDGGKEAGYLPKNAQIGGIIGNMLDEAADTFEPSYIGPFGRKSGIDALSSLWGQQGTHQDSETMSTLSSILGNLPGIGPAANAYTAAKAGKKAYDWMTSPAPGKGAPAVPPSGNNKTSTAAAAISPTLSMLSVGGSAPGPYSPDYSKMKSTVPQASTPKDRYVQAQLTASPTPSSSSGSLAAVPGEDFATYQARVGSGSSFSPSPAPSAPSQPSSSNRAPSAARTQYEQAAASYLDSLKESDRVSSARKSYQDFVRSRDQGLNNIEKQAIPMQFITGQQNSLRRDAAIQENAIAGREQTALDEQQGTQAQALARYQIASDELASDQESAKPINVGGVLYQRQGDGSYKAVTPANQEGFTLGEGQVRYDAQGNPVAAGPSKPGGEGKLVTVNGKSYVQNADGSFSEPDLPGAGALSPTTQSAVSLIDQLLGQDTNAIAGAPGISSFFPGTDAQLTKNVAKQLSALLSLDNIKLLKGTGAISDKEGQLLANAASSLGIDSKSGRSNLSNSAFKTELAKLKETLSSAPGTIQATPDGLQWKVMPDGSYEQVSFKSGANRPQRNNNPGNVKKGGLDEVDSMAIGQDEQGHLIFPDVATGLRAVALDLDAKISGNSRYVPANPTLAQIGRVYAEDGTWASKVAKLLGVSPNALASSLDRNELISAIATQEGFYA